MRNRVLKSALTLAAFLPALAMAQSHPAHRAGSWEFGVGGGFMYLDASLRDFLGSGAPEYRFANSVRPSRGTPHALARVGYNFTRSFGLSVSGGAAMNSGVILMTPAFALTYTLNVNAKTSPFVLIGTQFTRITGQNKRTTHSVWGAQAGLGIRHMVANHLALRLEGVMRFDGYDEVGMSRNTVYSPVATLGISYFVGGAQAPVPPPVRVRVDTIQQFHVDTVRTTLRDTMIRYHFDTVRVAVLQQLVESSPDQLVLRVQFQTNLTTLLPVSRPVLDGIAIAIIATPGSRWEIMGHTDSIGTVEANKILSQGRAQTVVDYLVSKGVDRSIMTAIGIGPDRPVFSNSTVYGRAQNRRVQLRRVPPPPVGVPVR